ncbi:hypothetical protein [Frateuria terrea]|uniref:Uncharacterized protein n=1 Tax=Frateuria terrea TaxID=529704 RepID=A0A1H6ZY61_9GAMM|nr:hypothetical protein [Frateuria terrea]SEJ54530.1 hypothetical protein SAMN04487997_0159 [Frateuria terrea]SFP47903.1 hypothetical protein SAMN02927913_2231 [Frateuria terrea]
MTPICKHEVEVKHCADCLPAAAMKAARKLFTVKGRYHSQIAMCELGELLGYPVVWPNKKEQEVE